MGFWQRLGFGKNTKSHSYRMERAKQLHGQSIRYVTERIDDNDNVIGRGGSLSLRGEEFLVFSSNEILLRAKVADLDASDLLSGDGVVLTAPNLEDGGKMRTVIAYFVYYRK